MENIEQATSRICLVHCIEGIDIRTVLETRMAKRNILVKYITNSIIYASTTIIYWIIQAEKPERQYHTRLYHTRLYHTSLTVSSESNAALTVK